MLEKLQLEYIGAESAHEGICIDFMVTNQYGEYCFAISDTTSYYKVKVFVKARNFLVRKGET
jgi:hypothetical protein